MNTQETSRVTMTLETFQLEVVERSHKAFQAASMDLDLDGGPETINNMNITMASLAMAYVTVCRSLDMSEELIVEGIRLANQVVAETLREEDSEP
jgi:hypothetical protein